MASWRDLSRDAILAAKRLLLDDCRRSSTSRAYYAAYSAVAARMTEEQVSFHAGWNNPSHDQIPRWLAHHGKWPIGRRRLIANAMRRLRMARENADYRPSISITRSDVIRSCKDAAMILQWLGVQYANDL